MDILILIALLLAVAGAVYWAASQKRKRMGGPKGPHTGHRRRHDDRPDHPGPKT